jgi:hypothetical protein
MGMADRGDLLGHFDERMESCMDSAKRLPSHHSPHERRGTRLALELRCGQSAPRQRRAGLQLSGALVHHRVCSAEIRRTMTRGGISGTPEVSGGVWNWVGVIGV